VLRVVRRTVEMGGGLLVVDVDVPAVVFFPHLVFALEEDRYLDPAKGHRFGVLTRAAAP
jgi:hypothetical protein